MINYYVILALFTQSRGWKEHSINSFFILSSVCLCTETYLNFSWFILQLLFFEGLIVQLMALDNADAGIEEGIVNLAVVEQTLVGRWRPRLRQLFLRIHHLFLLDFLKFGVQFLLQTHLLARILDLGLELLKQLGLSKLYFFENRSRYLFWNRISALSSVILLNLVSCIKKLLNLLLLNLFY